MLARGIAVNRALFAALLCTVTLAAPLAQTPSPAKLGAGVSDRAATPIADLYKSPESFVGQTVRVEGIVTAVCEQMGCWMALAAADQPSQTVRFKVDHDGALTFPISAKGKAATAEGVFEKIAANDHEAREAAAEQLGQGKKDAFGQTYQVKVTGAVIK